MNRPHFSERGVLLPIALLLILALSAASMSALILARTELLSQGGDHRYLRMRVGEEERIGSSFVDGSGVEFPEVGVLTTPLGGGFLLLAASSGDNTPASHAVYWQIQPDSVAHHLLPGALEVGEGGAPADGVREMTQEEGCPQGNAEPIVRIRNQSAGPIPIPALPLPPRLGPLGLEEFTNLSEQALDQEGDLPEAVSGAIAILHAPPGAAIQGGDGIGVLLGGGDLHLSGGARFRGLVMVRGNLWMTEGARIEGVALVGGGASVAGGAVILGCPGIAGEVLDQPVLTRPRPVAGGSLLGRF